MSLHRFNAKRDANERQICDALERFGFHCTRISSRGVPDLLISARRHQWLVEIKSAKGTLTPEQQAFRARWKGCDIAIFRSVADATTWAMKRMTGRDPYCYDREPTLIETGPARKAA